MMNGILLKEKYFPVVIRNQDSEEFHTKLNDFYNSGNATHMMRFFERTIQELYLTKEIVKPISSKSKSFGFER